MPTLVQLYSARDHGPWEPVLDRIAALGFDGVEGFFGNFDDPAAFRAALAARGLTMPQAHVPLALLEEDFDTALKIARTLGIFTLIAPWLAPEERPSDAAGWQGLGRRLDRIETRLRGLGLRLAWHNHDFELLTLPDGQVPMDILLAEAPGMDWEADLGWVIRAGQATDYWLARHAGRIVAVHLKDISGAEDEGGWADLGYGVTDWHPVFAAMAGLPRLSARVAEHDQPADLGRFLSRWKLSHDRLVARSGAQSDSYAHVAILCRDIGPQLAFYTEVIGLAPMFKLPLAPDRNIHYLRLTDQHYLELFDWGQGGVPPASQSGLHHFCLEVADLDASVARLRARGLRMCRWQDDRLVKVEGDAITTGLDGNRQSWLLDPEGNAIELMQIDRDSLQMVAIARLGRA